VVWDLVGVGREIAGRRPVRAALVDSEFEAAVRACKLSRLALALLLRPRGVVAIPFFQDLRIAGILQLTVIFVAKNAGLFFPGFLRKFARF
jgi:hypothetical protein